MLPHPTLHSLLDAQENFEALNRNPSWRTPTFEAGWGHYSQGNGLDVAYAKDAFGLVMVKGVITKSSTWVTGFPGELMFSLPVGFRPAPSDRRAFTVLTAGFTALEVDAYGDGQVRIVSGTTAAGAPVLLDGISFWAEG